MLHLKDCAWPVKPERAGDRSSCFSILKIARFLCDTVNRADWSKSQMNFGPDFSCQSRTTSRIIGWCAMLTLIGKKSGPKNLKQIANDFPDRFFLPINNNETVTWRWDAFDWSQWGQQRAGRKIRFGGTDCTSSPLGEEEDIRLEDGNGVQRDGADWTAIANHFSRKKMSSQSNLFTLPPLRWPPWFSLVFGLPWIIGCCLWTKFGLF